MIRALLFALAACVAAAPASAETLRVAVTTSFHNSGLAEVLLPEITRDTGLDVQLLVVGTGQAIRLGEAGDVDAILVHARAAEDAFVAAGHGTHRREIMYNDFILVGPSDDPAKAIGAVTISHALSAIAESQSAFVSRGDESGTHTRERALWQGAGIVPAPPWYRAAGSGMGATLNTAAAMGAYTLSDRASWLNFSNRADMRLVFENDPALFNQYAYVPVNPRRHPHVAHDAARVLENWLTSEKGQGQIAAFRLEGQQVFTPNAVAEEAPTQGN